MTSNINSPPARSLWIRAFSQLADIRNGDYVSLPRLQAAMGLDTGQTLRDALAAGEREGLLLIDRGAMPVTYRATFALERQIMLFA